MKSKRLDFFCHSHVSLLINMGFTAVAIESRVGHESSDITFPYAHMFPSEQKQMATMLNDAFVITDKDLNLYKEVMRKMNQKMSSSEMFEGYQEIYEAKMMNRMDGTQEKKWDRSR